MRGKSEHWGERPSPSQILSRHTDDRKQYLPLRPTSKIMASGIEVAGLTLAILPLVVNQIDTYILGIERIKLLRRYQREFKGYSRGLKAQQVILLNTLEQALEGVVHDEEKVLDLINDPLGPGWKNKELQKNLRCKLGRSHDIFLENMAELHELIEILSRKLQINTPGEQVSKVPSNPRKS